MVIYSNADGPDKLLLWVIEKFLNHAVSEEWTAEA